MVICQVNTDRVIMMIIVSIVAAIISNIACLTVTQSSSLCSSTVLSRSILSLLSWFRVSTTSGMQPLED